MGKEKIISVSFGNLVTPLQRGARLRVLLETTSLNFYLINSLRCDATLLLVGVLSFGYGIQKDS